MATMVAHLKALAEAIGADHKAIKSDIPAVEQTLGQSTTSTVSQKLLTDTVGDINAILDEINGEIV